MQGHPFCNVKRTVKPFDIREHLVIYLIPVSALEEYAQVEILVSEVTGKPISEFRNGAAGENPVVPINDPIRNTFRPAYIFIFHIARLNARPLVSMSEYLQRRLKYALILQQVKFPYWLSYRGEGSIVVIINPARGNRRSTR